MQSVRWAFNSHRWQPSKEDWIRAAQCLQKEEKDRIGKFVFKKDGKSSMVNNNNNNALSTIARNKVDLCGLLYGFSY